MENLFIDILELTLPISVLIGILLMFSPFLKNSYVAKWRYYMWLFAGVRLILPFKLTPRSPITIPVKIGQGVESAAEGLGATRILTLVWLAGIAVIAAYQICSYLSFKRLVRRWGRRVTDAEVLEAAEEAMEFAGVKRDVSVKRCRAIASPMMFGLIKPELIIPDIDYDIGDLPVILRHEFVHLKRRDIWYKMLMLAARTIHWFNPIVYLMYNAADRDIELACDEEVVNGRDADYRRHYCRAILNFAHTGCRAKTEISTCFIFSKKAVKERFGAILNEKIKKKGVFMFCVVAASIALSGGLITFATERVSKEIEENLQIIERPAEAPQESAAPKMTEPVSETGAVREPISDGADTYAAADNGGADTAYAPDAYAGAAGYAPETNAAPDSGSISGAPDTDSLGEPDSVSIDGSRETYSMPDGSTAIVQYENGEPEMGYILK